MGSKPWRKRRRVSRLGARNIMRAVLTGLSESGHPTNSPMESRLAAIPLGIKQPKTRLGVGTKNPVRSKKRAVVIDTGPKKSDQTNRSLEWTTEFALKTI